MYVFFIKKIYRANFLFFQSVEAAGLCFPSWCLERNADRRLAFFQSMKRPSMKRAKSITRDDM
jgi:hypothetical protein